MSYPYPQDRSRDKREKGQQPYEDAVESYTENEARIERDAPNPHQRPPRRTDEMQEQEAGERLREIGDDLATRHEGEYGNGRKHGESAS
jgi:hypothetical protein